MSLARPKRKATINKSYNDAIEELPYDDSAVSSHSSVTSFTSITSNSSNGGGSIKRKPLKKQAATAGETKSGTPPNGSKGVKPPSLPHNWQPIPTHEDYFSHRLDLSDAYIDLTTQTLYCPNQEPFTNDTNPYNNKRRSGKAEPFSLQKGEYVYMVSEPPGEPYYIGRIMKFKSKFNDHNVDQVPEDSTYASPKDYLFQIQWFYRPRDISKSTADSRLLFASMHSDTCPIISFRGKVTVRHKQDIEDEYASKTQKPANGTKSKNGPLSIAQSTKKSASPVSGLSALEAYTQQPNCFYFDKLFDRYMIKFYDVLSTTNLLQYTDSQDSKSKNFLIALNKRFEFIFAETQRTKSLVNTFSSTSCNCEKCGQWCASAQDSINCIVCEKYYHMLCLEPPLLKRPSRGFSWSCALCTKKHDIEYQSKKLLMLSHDNKSSNASQLTNELSALSSPQNGTIEYSRSTSNLSSQEDTPQEETETQDDEVDVDVDMDSPDTLPKYETMAIEFLENDSGFSLDERRLKEEWCMRYLGMHSRLEDGVDLEDRSPYPRASTRLGAKHQATNIPDYYDRPLVYYDVDRSSSKKKSSSSTAKRPAPKEKSEPCTQRLEVPEEYKDVTPKEYPQWLQPRPKGYVERGVDDGEGISCTLLWKSPESDEADNYAKLENYLSLCAPQAETLNLSPNTPNFVDAALKTYLETGGDVEKCLDIVNKFTRKSLHEPTFNREEIKRFEAGVKQFGSELLHVYKKVRTQPFSMVVRFYYLWKKSKNGRAIWGNFEGRMQKKLQNTKEETKTEVTKPATTTYIDSLAHPDDDSSYENNKIREQKRAFTCKHCLTHNSRQWFRITGHDANLKVSKDETEAPVDNDSVTALCFRCARLWRRYAVVWEDPNEIEKKNTKTSGWKKKVEAELIKDSSMILDEAELRGAVLSYGADGDAYDYEEDGNYLAIPVPEVHVEPKRKTSKAKKQEPLISDSPSRKSVKKDDKKVDEANNEGPPPKKKKVAPSAQAKNGKKSASKTGKVDTKTPPLKDKKEKKEKEVSVEPAQAKEKETKETKARKRKIKEEIKVEVSDALMIKNEKPLPATKKQKKSASAQLATFTPPLNPDYVRPLLDSLMKFDKKSVPALNRETLADIIKNFRRRQLLDLTSQFQGMQIPHLTSIALPFETNERKCCVCREHDTSEESNSEMLICSHCGVNAHCTCIGVTIPENVPKPAKEWLCEPCINDLKPCKSTVYTCSLCLANESNYELSMLGSPLVKPDFLKPIFESGKWCHFLCAIFNHRLVEFKSNSHLLGSTLATTATKKPKEENTLVKSLIESTQSPIAIEGVSRLYLKHYHSKCGICDSRNGSMIRCELCSDGETYHVTCAQDTPNFKLGFKLDTATINEKDSTMVRVGESYGKLKPILICPNHDQSTATIYNMRARGKRAHGAGKDELKPLIQLFLEGLVKQNSSKLTGPQFRSNNYIQNCKLFEEEDRLLRAKVQTSYFGSLPKRFQASCESCKTVASPIWWATDESTGQRYMVSTVEGDGESLLCQTCYHNQRQTESPEENGEESSAPSEEPRTESLLEVLRKPLDGSLYGIQDENDNLSKLYTPKLISQGEKSTTANECTRSRISIGDILS